MSSTRRPSLASRTISSPGATLRPTPARNAQAPTGLGILTPPSSPKHSKSSSDIRDDGSDLPDSNGLCSTGRGTVSYTDDGILICPFKIEYIRDQCEQAQTFGYGAWSTVYKATCHNRTTTEHGLLTPPPSPRLNAPILVAIKSPSRKDALPIVRSEAQALTRLRPLDDNEHYIAKFHGIIEHECALVLEAHPLSLESHIKACAEVAKESYTRDNMSNPVVGNAEIWLDLAQKLISTLDWLHNEAMTVHGDIKPGNILLKPESNPSLFPYRPLLIDFSSSQDLSTHKITQNTLSALTLEYTAPELLSVRVLTDPNSAATTASDVFSLAVTLLVAATGQILVYPGCNEFQKRHFAQSGNLILSNVRNFSNRAPRHGVVSRLLERAVLKKDMGRISTGAWTELVEDTIHGMNGEPAKI